MGDRRTTAVLAALCTTVLAALVTGSTFAATPSCPLGATMNIVAHEDDDLLFLSPDLIHDVQAGRCVRTVFVTAGAFPGDTDYGAQREAGSRAANALMAGVANSWTTTDAGISGHPMPLLTLAAKPTVSLVFMHLPQSPFGGADSSTGSINARGQVTGRAQDGLGTTHAVIWQLGPAKP